MRIAVIQSFLPSTSNGGAGHCAHDIANALTRRGHDVTVFSQDPRPAGADYAVEVVAPPHARGSSLLSRLSRVYLFPLALARCNFSGFDVVHAHGDNQFLRPGPTPVVRTLHGSALAEAAHQPRLKHKVLHLSLYLLELVGALRAQVRVGVSRSTRRHYPRVEAVIPNGIDTRLFRPLPNGKSVRPSMLFVGHQLHDRKRGAFLLHVFQEQVLPAVPDAELWMVLDEQPRGDSVRWYQNLPQRQLVELYQRAWVFCLPSLYEGFGRPYAEAMACGTPVVATPNPGAREVLADGECGLIVDDRYLGVNLVELFRSSTLQKTLTRQGLARVQQEYSLEHVVDSYENIYTRLTGRRAVADVGTVR